ncbi:glycosyltransferase 87 family protein [Nocardioides sp. BP30]|uniref:glycosyltransferase family 87 protein n=1 Tax=Nocardioides sp. BP30 TaxID=3036374 RepID=UPI0024698E79|nr:glycosyltransferase 87 family protein [Nocardioides sp. BP30]WGL52532.1 glycosyltransferase 87 family protein [Nocardioides sp. BP30]
MAGVVAPAHEDRVVETLSESIGGPVGEHAGRHRWWTPVRVLLLLTAIVMALGMVQKSSCYSQTWSGGNTRYTHMCYSDLPYLYTGRGFAELKWPYSGDATTRARYEVMEYPVGIAYWAWGTAYVTHWLAGSPDLSPRAALSTDKLWGEDDVLHEIRLYVSVNTIGFAVVALLACWLIAGVNRRRPWDAAAFALSPALLLTGMINWDLLAVGFVAGALWAWSRDRPVLTGVMIGLGTATKLYPLFLLGGLLVICWRRRRWPDLIMAAGSAVIAWVVFNMPALLSGVAQWKVFWSFNSTRGADLGSLWLVAQQVTGHTFSAHTINVWSWLLFGGWCLAVLVLGLLAPRTPRFAQLGFLIVAGFLLVNKVYSPQYVLWLLPLAVLARPRWRDQLIWQATEVLYFAGVWWYLGGLFTAGGGDDQPFYWLVVVIRVLGELYLVGIVARDVLSPRHDPVVLTEAADEERAAQSTMISSNVVVV